MPLSFSVVLIESVSILVFFFNLIIMNFPQINSENDALQKKIHINLIIQLFLIITIQPSIILNKINCNFKI